jgi:ubiquinol-cytochrome c reductase cytochrome c subunit
MVKQWMTGGVMLVALALQVCAADAASPEHGKTVFMKMGCWQCHGTVGQGGAAGPRIAPDPLPFETLAAFVRSTNRAMPPYREAVLSNADLADIYAYLESVPKPPAADSLPLLKP